MKKKNIKILAIETSCDETSAAAISGAISNNQETITKQIPNSKFQIPKILSSVVSSSANLHAKTGGVVPEIASRAHMECLLPVVEQALEQAKLSQKSKVKSQKSKKGDLLEGITHIAVTNGPGLIGSLLVGFNAAKTIAYARNLPFIPINHIEGHIYSALGEECRNPNDECQKAISYQLSAKNFPILALTVSGGHTSLTLMKDHGVYETIGETIDDAAGEAFDKVAKLLELGYPGGPVVSKLADSFRQVIARSEATKSSEGDPVGQSNTKDCHDPSGLAMTEAIEFPRPLLNKPNFDFSFSGLKTAVLTHVLKLKANSSQLTASQIEEICFAFEEAAVDVLVTKTIRAAKKYHPKEVILAGGVAANSRLRQELNLQLTANSLQLFVPPIELCGDNAAMIGLAAYYHIIKNNIPELFNTTVDSNLEL